MWSVRKTTCTRNRTPRTLQRSDDVAPARLFRSQTTDLATFVRPCVEARGVRVESRHSPRNACLDLVREMRRSFRCSATSRSQVLPIECRVTKSVCKAYGHGCGRHTVNERAAARAPATPNNKACCLVYSIPAGRSGCKCQSRRGGLPAQRNFERRKTA